MGGVDRMTEEENSEGFCNDKGIPITVGINGYYQFIDGVEQPPRATRSINDIQFAIDNEIYDECDIIRILLRMLTKQEEICQLLQELLPLPSV